MITQPWLSMLLILVGGVHVLVVLYAYRATQEPDDGVGPADNATQPVESTAVECPECGTTNEREYRYCAYCVAELPGRAEVDRTSTAPVGGQIF